MYGGVTVYLISLANGLLSCTTLILYLKSALFNFPFSSCLGRAKWLSGKIIEHMGVKIDLLGQICMLAGLG